MINEAAWQVEVTAHDLIELRKRIAQASVDSMDRVFVDKAFKSGLIKEHPLEVARFLLSYGGVNPLAKLSE